MTEHVHNVILYRVDPTRNMQRFYGLSIQPNLFGGQSLIRSWGRIGSVGQMKAELFDNDGKAAIRAQKILKQKQQRGYLFEAGSGQNL